MKNIVLILFSFAFSLTAFSQTINFKTKSFNESTNNSLITDIVSHKNYYYFVQVNNPSTNKFYSLIKTNESFDIVEKIDVLSIKKDKIIDNAILKFYDNKLWLLSKPRNSNFYYSYSLDENLENIDIIDSIDVSNKIINNTSFKQKGDSNIYYTIGWLTTKNSNIVLGNIYLELENGKIENVKEFDSNISNITAFTSLDSAGFFLTNFSKESYLFDTEFNPIDTIINNYTIKDSSGTYGLLFDMSDCHFSDHLTCFGRQLINSNYSISAIHFDTEPALSIQNVVPLFDNKNDSNGILHLLHKIDKKGNHILVFHSYTFPGNGVTPNLIYVYKLTEKLEIVWTKIFANKNEHTVRAVDITSENEILLAGHYKSYLLQPQFKDFYLKVSEAGSVISKSEIIEDTEIFLSPNPCTNYLTIDFDKNRRYRYIIYSINGQFMKEDKLSSQINVLDFSAGMYLMKIISNDGIVITRKFIKQ